MWLYEYEAWLLLNCRAVGSWASAAAEAISQLEPSMRPFAADSSGSVGSWLKDVSTPL